MRDTGRLPRRGCHSRAAAPVSLSRYGLSSPCRGRVGEGVRSRCHSGFATGPEERSGRAVEGSHQGSVGGGDVTIGRPP